jgi:hypothetical protein
MKKIDKMCQRAKTLLKCAQALIEQRAELNRFEYKLSKQIDYLLERYKELEAEISKERFK